MKPLVYFVDKVGKDNYVLTKEELNKILEEVYQAGYEDGIRYVSPLRDTPIPTIQEWWKDGATCNTLTAPPESIKITY